MEMLLFVGLQAAGKSTFFKEKWYETHMRLNMDMLRTRRREAILLDALLQAKQPFVVDNTNPTAEDRKAYIDKAQAHRFRIVGYYFVPDYLESINRNEGRSGKAKIPEIGIRSVMKKLQQPTWDEGFDDIYDVTSKNGVFTVEARAGKPQLPGPASY
ncbi:AAA family ATPase [Paenibacillus harenae]|uniref:AAA family ATPase n=1 Tax=Paenibacillus harenae TaxID=306543 RepID=UPI00278D062E|nr:AAA family ATPase [Paenibacillus harenae]MDQ0057929.1 putative kinase [Paenibacillus harenae]